MKQNALKILGKLLGIKIVAQLFVFVTVGWTCLRIFELDPLWSGIIAMFSAFGTIAATWNIGKLLN